MIRDQQDWGQLHALREGQLVLLLPSRGEHIEERCGTSQWPPIGTHASRED